MKRLVLVLIAMLVMCSVWAQQPIDAPTPPPSQAMTNQDVLDMIKGKLTDQTIVLAIQNSPSTAFDTSPQTLIQLSKQGVSQAVLDAMINPKKPTAPAMPPMQMPVMPWVASAKQVPGLPEEMGIYYKSTSGFTALREAPMAGAKVKYGMGMAFGMGARGAMKWDGAHAEMQLTDTKPVFYVFKAGWDERSVKILHVTVVDKDQTRELVMKRTQPGPRAEDIVDIDTHVIVSGQFGIFTVTPKTPMAPGEYLVAPYEMGQMGCEFGIVAPTGVPANK